MKTLLLTSFLAFCLSAAAAPLSGVKSVGPTGDYASLTAAIADIQAQSLGSALVLELQSTYLSTAETFPLTIPALNGASAANALTIRPASDATALSIASADTTAATVDLNGAQFVTFDGRPGGTGTTKQLTIANTSTSGVALRFINDGEQQRHPIHHPSRREHQRHQRRGRLQHHDRSKRQRQQHARSLRHP